MNSPNLLEVIELLSRRGISITFSDETMKGQTLTITMNKGDKTLTWMIPWLLIKQACFDMIADQIGMNSHLFQ